jgi:hypothetical protein
MMYEDIKVIKITIYWDVTACRLVHLYWRFEGYHWNNSQDEN